MWRSTWLKEIRYFKPVKPDIILSLIITFSLNVLFINKYLQWWMFHLSPPFVGEMSEFPITQLLNPIFLIHVLEKQIILAPETVAEIIVISALWSIKQNSTTLIEWCLAAETAPLIPIVLCRNIPKVTSFVCWSLGMFCPNVILTFSSRIGFVTSCFLTQQLE